MSKTYVSRTLNDFLSESKSITLKRKYGERPTITAGTNAPLRNQVLCYVAESDTVDKRDLKAFILGLKEDGAATVAAANMFLKRNAKYFITESKGGVTYFKLSNLGRRLVNQFVPTQETNVSESATANVRRKLNERFVEDEQVDGKSEPRSGDDDFGAGAFAGINPDDIPEDGEGELPVDDEDSHFEGPLPDLNALHDDGSPREEGEPAEDLEAKVAELEARIAELEAQLGEGEKEPEESDSIAHLVADKIDIDEPEEGEEVEPEEEEPESDEEVSEEENPEVDEEAERPEEPFRDHDFEDKGRPGLEDMDESLSERRKSRMEQIIENLKAKRNELNEADVKPEETDELTDDDLGDVKLDDEGEEDEPEPGAETDKDGDEVEKVEITEFIITVENVDEAIDELEERGVTAERVPVEPKEEEVPQDTEEPEEPEEEKPEGEEEKSEEGGEDLDLDLGTPDDKAAKESLRAFVLANYSNINEAEDEDEDKEKPEGDEDAGASDELSLGDQGEDAKELDDQPEGGDELTEPTTEFEENKIKVKAEDWEVLKGWLEEKGVDVQEMFGGEIETQEIDPEAEASDVDGEGAAEEISDDDIDFSGIGDKDDTKVKSEVKESFKGKKCPTCGGVMKNEVCETCEGADDDKKTEEEDVEECSK
jgi:hypothetical protein